MRLEEKISKWIEDVLDDEIDEEDGDHYDVDSQVKYIESAKHRTRMLVTSHVILYVCGGFEHIMINCAMDYPDQSIIRAVMENAIDTLRDEAGASASLRDVEEILERLDEDEEDTEE